MKTEGKETIKSRMNSKILIRVALAEEKGTGLVGK